MRKLGRVAIIQAVTGVILILNGVLLTVLALTGALQ